jgi:hypothetical protein
VSKRRSVEEKKRRREEGLGNPGENKGRNHRRNKTQESNRILQETQQDKTMNRKTKYHHYLELSSVQMGSAASADVTHVAAQQEG